MTKQKVIDSTKKIRKRKEIERYAIKWNKRWRANTYHETTPYIVLKCNKESSWDVSRSSHRVYSVKKGILKNSANFTEKDLCWSLFLIKLQAFKPAYLLKRDPNTVQVFSCENCKMRTTCSVFLKPKLQIMQLAHYFWNSNYK